MSGSGDSPNHLLAQARRSLKSPSGSGRDMSRQELAEAVNTYLWERHQERDHVDATYVGHLEQGRYRWPGARRREAFRQVLGVARDAEIGFYVNRTLTPRAKTLPGDPGRDAVSLRLLLDGREVVVPLSRRLLLQAGIGSLVEAFALGQQFDMLHEIMTQRRHIDGLVVTSPAHLREIVAHLREQWHALVKTDNLFGPRFALAGVLNQIALVEALRAVLRDKQQLEVIRLGAQYAESAAWLYEDAGNMAQARHWTSYAMEWAHEGADERMLAWTIFRRSQQAAATPDAAQVIGLAQAARRADDQLAKPTRAAIRVQEAYGHALDGDEQTSQRLLDEAHAWAASDTVGDAHEGHGSYCTPSYIEIQRANCWLTTGKPKKAITLYEEGLATLPVVYQRTRAAALSRLAVAYIADGQIEQAASAAHAALPVALGGGSMRIVDEVKGVGRELAPYRRLHGVATLLDDLGSNGER